MMITTLLLLAASSSTPAVESYQPALYEWGMCVKTKARSWNPSGEPVETLVNTAYFSCQSLRDKALMVVRTSPETEMFGGNAERKSFAEKLLAKMDTIVKNAAYEDLLNLRVGQKASEGAKGVHK